MLDWRLLSKKSFVEVVSAKLATEILPRFEVQLKSAVEHPNGFLKIAFNIECDDAIEMRIHIWDNASEFSDVHNHTSSFKSLLMLGSLEEQIFVATQGNDNAIYRCRSDNLSQGISFEPCGKVRLNLMRSSVIRASNFREISCDEFHRVRALEKSATLAVKLRTERGSSAVIPNQAATKEYIKLRELSRKEAFFRTQTAYNALIDLSKYEDTRYL